MQIKLSQNWQKELKNTLKSKEFSLLWKNIVDNYKHKNILPSQSLIFNAFNSCELNTVKVVILGQDPYPTPGYAHGLSFSVENSVKPFPKSLNNIFKELKNDINKEIPESGNLQHWASQGVFLLNTVLTVEALNANSHKKMGWQNFTNDVIKHISLKNNNVVFMLWGKQAQLKQEIIDSKKHLILTSVHPSPLSAYRGFFGCKHFSKTNNYLKEHNKKQIKW